MRWCVGLGLALLVTVCVGLSPSAAYAQEDSPLAQPRTTETVPTPGITVRGLENRWRSFRQAADGSEEEIRSFQIVHNARGELGIQGMRHHARLLLREARLAHEAGNGARAVQLEEWAESLAPGSTLTAFYHASRSWEESPWAVPGVLANTFAAYGTLSGEPADALLFKVHRRLIVFWFLVAFASVFLAVQLFRYFNLAAYDAASMVTHVVTVNLTRTSLVLLVALPAIIFGGPLLLLPLIALLVFAYQSWAERAVSIVVLGSLLLLPLLAGQMGAAIVAASSATLQHYSAQTDLCDSLCLERLDRAAEEADDVALFSRALLHARVGSEESLRLAWELLDRNFPEQLAHSVSLLRGNVLGIGGQGAAALRHFERVIAADDISDEMRVAAHYNAYRTLQDQDRGSAAENHLAQAQAIAPETIINAVDTVERRTNRWFMDARLEPSLVLAIAESDGRMSAESASAEVMAPLTGRLPAGWLLYLVAGVIGAMVLLLVGKKGLKSSKSCPRCGLVMSFREAPTQALAGYCPDCYSLFMEGASLDVARRQSLEAAVDNHGRRERLIAIAGNALGSGLGFLWKGPSLVGAGLVAVMVAGLVVLFCSAPALGSPFALEIARFDGRVLLAVLMLAIAFIGGWIATWVLRDSL